MTERREGLLELVLRNDPAETGRLAAALEDFSEAQSIPSKAAHHLTLVLDELVTNIIAYGYDPGAQGREIKIRLLAGRDAVTVEIEDDGRAFNPLEVPPPDLEEPLETRPIGGLGLHFLRSFMDDLCYRREQERNRLRFRKLLSPDETRKQDKSTR